MKTIAAFAIVLSVAAMCGGCTLGQVKANVEAQVAHDIAIQIAPAAVPDLLKVRDEANAQTPPDTFLANCMGDVASFIQVLAANNPPSLLGGGTVDKNGCKPAEYFDATAKECKIGAALAGYQAYLAAHAPPSPLIAVPDQLIADCAPPAARVQKDVNAFLLQFSVDLAGLKGAAAMGSAQTLQAVRAAGVHP